MKDSYRKTGSSLRTVTLAQAPKQPPLKLQSPRQIRYYDRLAFSWLPTLPCSNRPATTRYEKKAAKERGEEPKPRFLDSALQTLNSLGIEKRQIHFESYG